MSDSRKKTQGARRALPEQSEEEKRAFDEWWNPIVSGVEAALTYIEKLHFLDRFDLLELDGIRYFKLERLCERVENEALDQIRTEAKAKASAEEMAEYLARVRERYYFKHNFHYSTFRELEDELLEDELYASEAKPKTSSTDLAGSAYQRPSWQEVIKQADALPTLEEQIAYLKWVRKEDRLYVTEDVFEDLLAEADGKGPSFIEKLNIEIKYREELLNDASRSSKQTRTGHRPSDPLRWQGTQEQLAYLIYRLKDAGLIKPGRHWKQAAQSFVEEEGNSYKSSSTAVNRGGRI